MQGRGWRRWLPGLLVALVAVSASISGIRNGYAQDDTALVEEDARVHSLANIGQILTTSYWPPPATPDLYRPLATISFAVQWALGGGSPLVFRLLSELLYVLVSLGVFLLALRLLPRGVALAIAVLFAAHPVHVEAVALAVNQGEQWVALLSLVATIRYIDLRRRGPLSLGDWLFLGLVYLIACLFKEHAAIMPGFLLAAEWTILRADGGAPAIAASLRWPGFVWLAALGASFLFVRSQILGDFVGSFTAEALTGQSMGGRALTMLQVVPRWLGLLVWPSHLQGDYSPAVIEQATAWGFGQTLGALVLLGVAVLLVVCWRRAPVAAFGILWSGAALLPVSNILVATGIVLAERTLYLTSVGFLLATGAVVHLLLAARPERRLVPRLLAALCGVLVLLGVARSAMRHPDWRSQVYFWAKTVEDAPLSYRAHHAHAQLLWGLGYEGASVTAFHTAAALYPPSWWIRNELANRFRLKGDCYPALDLYAESLRINPEQPAARASAIACLVYLGKYQEAMDAADEALTYGRDVEDFQAYRATADSARLVGATPGTVQLTVPEAAVLR